MPEFKDYYNNILNTNFQKLKDYKQYIVPIIAVCFLFLFTKLGRGTKFVPKILNSIFVKIVIAIILCGILIFNNIKFSMIVYVIIFLLYWVLESNKESFENGNVPTFNLLNNNEQHCNYSGCNHQEGNECNECNNYMESIEGNGLIQRIRKMPDGSLIPLDDINFTNNNNIYDNRDFLEKTENKDKLKYVQHQMFDRLDNVTICPKPEIMKIHNEQFQPYVEKC